MTAGDHLLRPGPGAVPGVVPGGGPSGPRPAGPRRPGPAPGPRPGARPGEAGSGDHGSGDHGSGDLGSGDLGSSARGPGDRGAEKRDAAPDRGDAGQHDAEVAQVLADLGATPADAPPLAQAAALERVQERLARRLSGAAR